MRYWLFAEPAGKSSEPVWMIYSDEAIIAEYWEYWEGRMSAYNNAHGLSKYENVSVSNCIRDWVSTHWAVEATPEALLRIISAPKD